MKDKPSFPARMAGWEYQYERAEKAEAEALWRGEKLKHGRILFLEQQALAASRLELLRRCEYTFDYWKQNYFCPICQEVLPGFGDDEGGHADGCELDAECNG